MVVCAFVGVPLRHVGTGNSRSSLKSFREVGGSGKERHVEDRLRAAADRKDKLIVRSAVTAPDSPLSTIICATRMQVSTMAIHK
ncbi:hypothetical protein TNCV_3411891 [Trichonephila clavipes]|nr:hypothetical protein TNCV_3411891 [Trichonephila clavipes]